MGRNPNERYIVPSVVSAVTGVPQTTLQTWMQRGRLRNLDAIRQSQQGVSRLYSENDVCSLLIINRLLRMGIDHKTLISWIPTAVADYVFERNPFTSTVFRIDRDGAYRIEGRPSELAEIPISDIQICVEIASMVAEAKFALRQVLKSRGMEDEEDGLTGERG